MEVNVSNMTEQDWERWLAEWRESIGSSTSTVVKPRPKTRDTKSHEFMYEMGNGTYKARFFVTHETLGEVHGFWAPKKLVVSVSDSEVQLPSWFKPNIINYR